MLSARELSIFEFARGVGAMEVPSAERIQKTVADFMALRESAVVAGGVAVIHYGYERSTKDVGALYSDADTSILERLRPKFKTVIKAKSGWHKLEHRTTKVVLELIPEGGLTTYGFIPGPQTVGSEDDGFISLRGLVWMKLVSGRSQDDADIITLRKPRFRQAPALKKQLPAELQKRFEALLARAREEIKNDPYRRRK